MRCDFCRHPQCLTFQKFDSLNSVKYLFLRHLSEPGDNSLRLVVEEAMNESVSADAIERFECATELDELFKGSSPD